MNESVPDAQASLETMDPPAAEPAVQAPAVPFDWEPWAWGGALAVLVAIVYWPTVSHGYIWDDDAHVIANTTLRSAQGLHDMWLRWGAIPQYYPLTHTALWAEYQTWGLHPAGYHIVNIFLHAAVCVMLWRVLLRLRMPGAWIAAAVFAVHPVCVESVAWISEQKNLLSAALALGSILLYLRSSPPEESADDAPVKGGWDYELSLALFVAALLSKTVTAVVPAVLLCIYWWKRGRITSRDLADLAPMFIFGAVLGSVTVWLELASVGAAGQEWEYSLVDRTLIAGRSLWFYAGKVVWPHPLMFFYPRWEISAHDPLQYAFPAAVLAAVVILWMARKRIGRGPLAAALAFAVTLGPALGFFNVYPFRYSFVADHFQYHACMIMIASLVALVGSLVAKLRPQVQWLGAALAAVIIVPLAVESHQESYVFRDLDSLYGDVLEKNPASWIAHINLAGHMEATGREDEARDHYAEGLRLLTPANWRRGNLARALEVTGQLDKGIAQLNQDLTADLSDQERADVLCRLGDLWALKKDFDQAIQQFEKSLEFAPENAMTITNYGLALVAKEDYEGAAEKLQESLDLNPGQVRAQSQLGVSLRKLGRNEQAIEAFAKAIDLNPNDADVREELAIAYLALGDRQSAVNQVQIAMQLNPRSSGAHNLVGMLFAQQGSFDLAIKALETALELDPENTSAAENLQRLRDHMAKQTDAAKNAKSGSTSDAASPADAKDENQSDAPIEKPDSPPDAEATQATPGEPDAAPAAAPSEPPAAAPAPAEPPK